MNTIDIILSALPKKHKTVIAAAIIVLVGVVQGLASAEILPPKAIAFFMEVKEPLMLVALGLGGLGVRHALKKNQDATDALRQDLSKVPDPK